MRPEDSLMSTSKTAEEIQFNMDSSSKKEQSSELSQNPTNQSSKFELMSMSSDSEAGDPLEMQMESATDSDSDELEREPKVTQTPVVKKNKQLI